MIEIKCGCSLFFDRAKTNRNSPFIHSPAPISVISRRRQKCRNCVKMPSEMIDFKGKKQAAMIELTPLVQESAPWAERNLK